MTERIASPTAPLPPPELAARTGAVDPSDPLAGYDDLGQQLRRYIVDALPADWSFEGKRVLDFGCGAGRVLRAFLQEAQVAEFYGCDIDARSIEWLERHLSPPLHVLRSNESPPIELPGDSFDLVYAISVFTHLADEWSGWLLELHRLLKDGGYLLATFLGSGMSRRVAGEPWAETRVGMNVLRHGQSWDLGGPMVLHSPWWIREHWGRAFEIVELREAGVVTEAPGDGHGLVLMRKRPGTCTREELERIDPVTEPRELTALQHNVRQLHRESSEFQARAASIARAYRTLEGSRAVRFVGRLRSVQPRFRRPG